VLTLLVADTGTITTAGATGAVVASGVSIGGVWTAEGDAGSVTITATGENTATIAATDDAEFVAGTGTPTITVAAGKTLSTATSIDLGTTGSLVLTGADGDGGAKLTGTGAVKFGNASITGGANGWQAVVSGVSPKITFAVATSTATTPTITGAGTTPKLVGGDGAGAITIASDGVTSTNLTVTLAEIDLTTGGSVVINFTDTASKLTLTKSATVGKLTLNSAKLATTMAIGNAHYAVIWNGITGKGTVGGAGNITVTGETDTENTAAGSIAGNTADATITGETTTNAVTLSNAAVFADS
jgi:filamentous hemagglutinin